MKLTFTQGIVSGQKDGTNKPLYLQKNGNFVDLIVSPTPTVIAFADGTKTYIVEELKTVRNAWSIQAGACFLYWEIDALTAELHRKTTLMRPVYSISEVQSPILNQLWFDVTEKTFKQWNGWKWIKKICVLAGTVFSNGSIEPAPFGSHAGLNGEFDAGNIVLDSSGTPLRAQDGSFICTNTILRIANSGTASARLESNIITAVAAETIPKFSVVKMLPGKRIKLAKSSDYRTHAAGIVLFDLVSSEISSVISSGVVKNPEWSFPADKMNYPVFYNENAEITTNVPQEGVCQQVGFVYDSTSIFLNIQMPIQLDTSSVPVPPISSSAPITNFVTNVTSGYAPLTVEFTSTGTGSAQLEWDFFNSSNVDETGETAEYTYSTPGTYSVRLRGINSFGATEEIKTGYIQVLKAIVSTNVNLGTELITPNYIKPNETALLQIQVSNSGLGNATNVTRTLKLKTSNNSDVRIIDAPFNVTITRSNSAVSIVLPSIDIASNTVSTYGIQVQVQPNAKELFIFAEGTSLDHDVTLKDNTTTKTIGIRNGI